MNIKACGKKREKEAFVSRAMGIDDVMISIHSSAWVFRINKQWNNNRVWGYKIGYP
jgi:hypothetical protein